jgi:hypothetical protein
MCLFPKARRLWKWTSFSFLYWQFMKLSCEIRITLHRTGSWLNPDRTSDQRNWVLWNVHIECARKPNGFWNLKTILHAFQRFHTESHRAQCCLEFSWHGNISICVNKFFHFALKCYFISKTVRYFWRTLCDFVKPDFLGCSFVARATFPPLIYQ